jgi:hypothetical protein
MGTKPRLLLRPYPAESVLALLRLSVQSLAIMPMLHFALRQISADYVHYLAILIEGPREGELRGNNFSFVAARRSRQSSFHSRPASPWC